MEPRLQHPILRIHRLQQLVERSMELNPMVIAKPVVKHTLELEHPFIQQLQRLPRFLTLEPVIQPVGTNQRMERFQHPIRRSVPITIRFQLVER